MQRKKKKEKKKKKKKRKRKAIMTRSSHQNKYHKLKTDECLQSFKRQRNFCNRLYKREEKIVLKPKFKKHHR